MSGIGIGLLAFLVTIVTFIYFGLMSILLWKLAVEGPETRRTLGLPLLPALLQNFAIPIAIIGFTVRSTATVVVAGLMISAAMLLATDRSIWLHPEVEAPLLRLAMVTLALIGFFYSLA